MRESVSILESDINKTIENNDKKLKEEQLSLDRILQQKGHTDFSAAAGVTASSERSSYDLGVDFATPIIETISEDERIEVIQTNAPVEFNFAMDDDKRGATTVGLKVRSWWFEEIPKFPDLCDVAQFTRVQLSCIDVYTHPTPIII